MHQTSELYKQLLSGPHKVETRLTIGEPGHLMTEFGDTITFGGTSILVADSSADFGYDESMLVSVSTKSMVFKSSPSIGNTISSTIDVVMLKPVPAIPRMARLTPYVRLTDGVRHSEWIQKGVYFIDTREADDQDDNVDQLYITGYDAMMQAEADYPSSDMEWPAADTEVIQEIANTLKISVDPRTWDVVKGIYRINYPTGYSMREVIGYISAMYGANAMISDMGELLVAALAGIPKETRYLIDNLGFSITFGGDRIVV